MEEVGAAIKEIIHYHTIRGKFSSVHSDLEAEGITRVEVGEEGLHFFREQQAGELRQCYHCKLFSKLPVDEPKAKNRKGAHLSGSQGAAGSGSHGQIITDCKL